jgi:hypothetical protein
MKSVLSAAILLLFSSQSSAQNTKSDSSQTLEDVLVQETYEMEFEEEKLPVQINTDFSVLLEIPDRVHWSILDKSDPSSAEDGWEHFPFNLFAPELVNIRPEPIMRFRTKFKKLASWRFGIHRNDGQTFRIYEGKGNPPEYISWDGRGDEGESFIPGQNYSYSFTAIDKASNKRVFPGETFSVPAAYLSRPKGVEVGIASSELFTDDGLNLMPTAKDLAREVANLYRYYSHKGNISIEISHPRSDDFIQLMADNLMIAPGSIDRRLPKKGWEDSVVLWIE